MKIDYERCWKNLEYIYEEIKKRSPKSTVTYDIAVQVLKDMKEVEKIVKKNTK